MGGGGFPVPLFHAQFLVRWSYFLSSLGNTFTSWKGNAFSLFHMSEWCYNLKANLRCGSPPCFQTGHTLEPLMPLGTSLWSFYLDIYSTFCRANLPHDFIKAQKQQCQHFRCSVIPNSLLPEGFQAAVGWWEWKSGEIFGRQTCYSARIQGIIKQGNLGLEQGKEEDIGGEGGKGKSNFVKHITCPFIFSILW